MPNENAKASQSKTNECPRCGYDQRTVTPWRMWRDIRMTHPVRWGRIVAYFVLLALALYVMAAISLGMRCVADLDMTLKGAFFGGNPVKIATTATRWQAFLHGSLTPYSTRPIATVTMGGSTVTQGGTTLTFGAATWTLGSPRTYVSGMIEHQWPIAAVAVAIPLSCALAFAALPISRKRAKVRWVHVPRAMAYAYGLVWIAASLFMLASWHIVSPRVGIGFLGMIAFIYVMTSPIVLIAFWWATARLYLRMQHGLAVAVSVTLIGMLLPVTVAGAIWIARSG